MTTIQSRRKLIVIVLLVIAIGGALLRQFTDSRTTAHDVGTLLMLLWLPIIGNVIAWLISKLRRPAPPAAPVFVEGSAFHPHALVEFTLRPPQLPSENRPIPEGEHHCHLVVDNQGFAARWRVRPGEAVRRGEARSTEVEFLSPELAMPRFQGEVPFRMMVGESFVGDGRVLRSLA
jgi:hypothetical protein